MGKVGKKKARTKKKPPKIKKEETDFKFMILATGHSSHAFAHGE